MPIPVSARNVLQTTLFDAQRMLLERRNSRDILQYLNKRLRLLSHPPDYMVVRWDCDGIPIRYRSVSGEESPDVQDLFSPFVEARVPRSQLRTEEELEELEKLEELEEEIRDRY